MNKHVMAITYEPKINAVRSGECCQTIRQKRRARICEGDTILLHGWEGAPYRTKWSWRRRVTVTKVIPVILDYYSGVGVGNVGDWQFQWYRWDSEYATELAKRDFIDPPTGVGLRDTLVQLNKGLSFVPGQIVRWSCE